MSGPRGEPPLTATDPLGAFWLAWLRGVEAGMAVGTAWLALWQGAIAASRPGAVSVTLNLPFANGYTQRIEPWTNWGWVGQQKAGDAETEVEVLRDVASYGRQLGWLVDLTLDLAQKTDADPATLEPVRKLRDEVEAIKNRRKR